MANAPDYNKIANQIIEVVGGADNIISAAHCATRLRLIVKDRDIIDDKKVEETELVKGCFFTAGQYQIILGTGIVNKVFDEVIKLGVSGSSKNEQAAAAAQNGSTIQRLVRIFADVFVPIIPVMVATGLFMGIRGFLTQDAMLGFFGISADAIPQQFLDFTTILTDTAFSYLPVLVCWSAFKKFGGSPILGIVLGLMLVHTALPTSWDVAQGAAEPMLFFGFIKVNGYQSSVLPAFIVGFLGSKIEQWLHDHVINALDLIITPFVTVLTSLCLGLFVIGPVFHSVEMVLVHIVTWLFALPLGLGGLIWGALCQVIVITGVHHALNLVEIEMLSNTSWNPVNPVGSSGIVAQAGAAMAVAVKSKSVKMKSLAYPSAVSGLLGITEPAIFGVNLRLVKPFIWGCVGGGVGGWLSAVLNLRGTGLSVTGIPGALLYLNKQLPIYILVNAAAFGVAFTLTYLFGVKEDPENAERGAKEVPVIKEESEVKENQVKELRAFVSGNVIPVSEVNDPVFSSKAMGDGIAIRPSAQMVAAPCDGKISMVADTGHAIGITLNNGAELLIHVGLDTVSLNGEGFQVLVSEGRNVKQGAPLLKFDKAFIEGKGLAADCILVLTNTDDFPDIKFISGMDAKQSETVICTF